MYVIIIYDSIIDKPFAEKIYMTDTWRYNLKHISELTDNDKEQNLILIGGSQANRMVDEINSELTYPFFNYQGMDWKFENGGNGSNAVLEIIDSPFAPSWKYKKVLILGGVDRYGTENVVDYFLENYSTFRNNENSRLI